MRRSPYGERGLKFEEGIHRVDGYASLPVWGAWIEMSRHQRQEWHSSSLPVWGAWIEIKAYILPNGSASVAPRMGSVD